MTVAFGINPQHSHHVILFPVTFSAAVTQERAEEGGIIQDSPQSDRECLIVVHALVSVTRSSGFRAAKLPGQATRAAEPLYHSQVSV